MFILNYKPSFYKDLEKVVKDKVVRQQIISKTLELEQRAPIGKRLVGNPYWSIHVNKYRVVYELKGNSVDILRIIPRRFDYRELR